MTWAPNFTPLVCPFCEQACDFPPNPKPSRLRRISRQNGVETRVYEMDPDDVEGSLAEIRQEQEREKSHKGFADDSCLASCGCGSRMVLDTAEDMHDTSSDLMTHHPSVDARYVRRVDFWGPPANKGEEPREAENEWDGDWVDALFYRVS